MLVYVALFFKLVIFWEHGQLSLIDNYLILSFKQIVFKTSEFYPLTLSIEQLLNIAVLAELLVRAPGRKYVNIPEPQSHEMISERVHPTHAALY